MFPIPAGCGPLVRIQVLVAHPDDETFGCGSLLLHAHAAGAVTAVTCATRGEAGDVAPGVEVPPEGLGSLREREFRDAAALLGVRRVDVLDFRDSGMSGEAGPQTLVGTDPVELRAALARSVRSFGADVLVALDGTDGHRDHVAVREATVAVGNELDLPVYLSCLPRSVMRRWAKYMETVDPTSTYLHLGELGTPDEELTTVFDTRELLRARWEAIRLHRSQVSPFEGLPDDLATAFLGAEHLVAVQRLVPQP
jgi:LmbE family N-acetylglucosaminyl deacetylase